MAIMKIIASILLLLALRSNAAPLHSNPLAPNTIFLDGTNWTATPEQQQQTYQRVVGYVSRWNIDVTTDWPRDPQGDPEPRGDVAWVILGGASAGGDLAGESGVGNFRSGIIDSPFKRGLAAYVYSDALGNDPALVAFVVAHETGHALGEVHEDAGIMRPVTDLTADWTPHDVADFDALLGVYAPPDVAPDTPEPHLLLAVLTFWMSQRPNRHNSERPAVAGTSTNRVMDTGSRARHRALSFRAASSGSVALTNRVAAYRCSATSCSKSASTLYRGIAKA